MTAYAPKNLLPQREPDVEILIKKHFQFLRAGKSVEEILSMFYEDPWFSNRLASATATAITKAKGLACCADDIKQDALVLVHRALQRRACLGYDPEKGSYAGFLSTILIRSCQKALWQFRHTHHVAIESEIWHPHYDPSAEQDENLDLHQQIESLEEPYRGVLQSVCAGRSVDQIAASSGKSRRTIYRWLNTGMKVLEKRLA